MSRPLPGGLQGTGKWSWYLELLLVSHEMHTTGTSGIYRTTLCTVLRPSKAKGGDLIGVCTTASGDNSASRQSPSYKLQFAPQGR